MYVFEWAMKINERNKLWTYAMNDGNSCTISIHLDVTACFGFGFRMLLHYLACNGWAALEHTTCCNSYDYVEGWLYDWLCNYFVKLFKVLKTITNSHPHTHFAISKTYVENGEFHWTKIPWWITKNIGIV